MLLQTQVSTTYKQYTTMNILGVAVSRDNSGSYTLQQSCQLPCSRAALRVTAETLLGHDGDSIARRARQTREDSVPDVGLVFLL